jgi:hypothetical protein
MPRPKSSAPPRSASSRPRAEPGARRADSAHLQFELLVADEHVWQQGVPDAQVVIAPYAYRVTDPATGNRIGRFDKPVTAAISDSRIGAGTIYWTTAPANPPTGEPASTQPQVEGNAIRVNNGSARIGWFTTAPRR